MAELGYAHGLGPCLERGESSSLSVRTNCKLEFPIFRDGGNPVGVQLLPLALKELNLHLVGVRIEICEGSSVVEPDVANVVVAGSNPVPRSNENITYAGLLVGRDISEYKKIAIIPILCYI